MRQGISDVALALATLMTIVGWATALSVGPVPLLVAAALSAVGAVALPSAPRMLYALGLVTFPIYYLGIVFLGLSFVVHRALR